MYRLHMGPQNPHMFDIESWMASNEFPVTIDYNTWVKLSQVECIPIVMVVANLLLMSSNYY